MTTTKDVKNFWSKLTVDPGDAFKLLRIALESGTTAMMWGQYGVGKTSIVYQLADALMRIEDPLRRFEGCKVINPSQSEILDFKLPYIDKLETGEKISRFAFTDQLPRSGRWVIFVDEINTAPMSLQPTLYSLILEKRIGNYHLPEGCFCVAAGNREEDQCAAQTMSAALKDRLNLHMFVVPSSKNWGVWAAKNGIRPEIQAWIQNSPGALNGHDTKDPTGGCTPRALEALSKKMYALENNGELGTQLESLVINGTIGQGAASEFEGFLSLYRTKIDIETILKKPKVAPVPEKTDLLYCVTYALVDRLDDKTVSPIFEYLGRLPTTYSALVIKCLEQKGINITKYKEAKDFLTKNVNYFC